ncbi:MAG: extracellular solute-binding protein [Clostridiales bacterium]|jgi:putative aldouronate transport system substrate-binding protein|nr:extracellular solute-binding protein [Clostridiales bacterium]
MKTRKSLAALLACIMLMSIFAGCNANGESQSGTPSEESGQVSGVSFNEADFPITDEPTTLTAVMLSQSPNWEYNSDMYIFKKMEELTNVKLEITNIPGEQWWEQLQLMFASNELPDILFVGVGAFINASDVITYANAGQLLPLNDLLEKYAPTYTALTDQYPEKAKLYTPDGNMYGMTALIYPVDGNARPFINQQWAGDLGYEMPETYEDFVELLKAFRDSDPSGQGTIPLSGSAGGNEVDPFVAGPLGMTYGWSNKDTWQVVDGKIVHVTQHPMYEQYLKNMNELYSEKLLDQEYYTQSQSELLAKGAAMRVGAYVHSAHFLFTNSQDPAVYDQYRMPVPFTSEYFDEIACYQDAINPAGIFITSACENPEIAVRYLDYFFTDEAAEWMYGPEDQGDGKGGIEWTEDRTVFKINTDEDSDGAYDYTNRYIAPTNVIIGNYYYSDFSKKLEMALGDQSLTYNQQTYRVPYVKPAAPTLYLSAAEIEQTAMIADAVNTYYAQMESKIVMGEEPLESYADMISHLESLGLNDLVEAYNTAYDRYKSNMN